MAGSTRRWLERTHGQLEELLTQRGRRVMLTEQMVDEKGRPRDPYDYFERDPASLVTLRWNWHGIVHTAQSASRNMAIEKEAPPWPGFEQVWIPVAEDVQLSGRLGFAEIDGQRPTAACIVLLPGLFGDNGVLRTRDLAQALRRAGFHVLALELRGHGLTEYRYPDVFYNFGVVEAQDLIRVSEWLEDNHEPIDRTGLIGFCWGGNLGMLTAWFDGRKPDDPSITPQLSTILDPPSARCHYNAGVLAFSPVLRWEDLMDVTDVRHSKWTQPTTYYFQETIRDRMRRKAHPEISGSLRHLVDYEFARSSVTSAFPAREVYLFIRFLPYDGRPAGDKLEFARVPVLMVTSVNDPFLSARDLPDLIATVDNPLVAGLILRGGGHIGFAPYNPAYFYSLIVNFFDPHTGAAACTSKRTSKRGQKPFTSR